jgi:hypothetical protein
MRKPSEVRGKKPIHSYDPLNDLDAEVHDEPGHVRYIIEDPEPIRGPGFWANWISQTVSETRISDRLEAHGGTRFYTIQAIVLGSVEDFVIVTDKSGTRYRLAASDVRSPHTETFRH